MSTSAPAAFPDAAETWNKRFRTDDYIFGTEPNAWLREQAPVWQPGQRVLCVADGEGRNSVWLAKQGLRVAKVAAASGKEVCGVRRWALEVQGRTNHNKAACALANKLARICYATLRDKTAFDETARLSRKMNRQAFAMPA